MNENLSLFYPDVEHRKYEVTLIKRVCENTYIYIPPTHLSSNCGITQFLRHHIAFVLWLLY
jgi:hypothetical protein